MGGSTGAEDETELSKVWFDEKAFEAFAKGYLSEMKGDLTKDELELLPCLREFFVILIVQMSEFQILQHSEAPLRFYLL